jgi:50S ribosomal protein L16 3-hydroxylase
MALRSENAAMNLHEPLALLGGRSPSAFLRRHWQRQPLLVRQAWPGVQPPASRAELFALAGQDGVESRIVQQATQVGAPAWQLQRGPFTRRAFPPVRQPGWTLLVQGLDLHLDSAHALLAPFRFLPAARLDDVMVSWASPGGGVGPHWDAYDVFLLQVQGRRRWRVGPVASRALVPGLPVKILRHFKPTSEWLLEPGDMLYLPALWGHDGVAEGGDCVTCSIGFRAPAAAELAGELLARLADQDSADGATPMRYRDPPPRPGASPAPHGQVPAALQAFARRAVQQALAEPLALARALGEWATEPKPQVWFEPAARPRRAGSGLRLDRRTRMMFDDEHVFINGEAYRASGRDALCMQALANQRHLAAAALRGLSAGARALLAQWHGAGWLHDH